MAGYSTEDRDRSKDMFMHICRSAHHPSQKALSVVIVLLSCVVAGCRKPAPAPVTLTFLGAWWLQPTYRNRSEETEKPVRGLLTLDTAKFQYLHGAKDASKISPDTYTFDQTF